jgi:Methyltransferase domain
LLAHWEPVVAPLLDALDPRVVVEVGMARGDTSELLIELAAARGFTVHGVDPLKHPDLAVERFQERLGERFRFHEAKSLDVLPGIRDADAVLLDGDHNWYTVHAELTALAVVARDERRPFPLTLMHDVGWPYARRDMYYDPGSIPEEFRHPYRRAGMLPGVSELADDGGVGAGINNALHEGGPRNGVRTAIDDFLAEAPELLGRTLGYQEVTGFSGLGIVADEEQLDRSPALRERLAELRTPEWLQAQCERLEDGRMAVVRLFQETRGTLRAERGG